MARPQKQTIDYFSHYVSHGKTMLILQNEFGNDGYAFWYRLLELLCKAENQFYDYNSSAAWRLLLAETHVKEDIASNILKTLAEVDAIDGELYQNKIIWVQHLVDNLDLVYNRRATGKPQKPVIVNKNGVNVIKNGVNVNKSTQTKLNKTKLNKTNNTIVVFDHWNKQNIINHKILNGAESPINTALKTYTIDEINQSISNYSEILKGEQYFFKYRWTLKEFLRRGLEKFMNGDIARQNFLKDKNGGNGNGGLHGQVATRNEGNGKQPSKVTARTEGYSTSEYLESLK